MALEALQNCLPLDKDFTQFLAQVNKLSFVQFDLPFELRQVLLDSKHIFTHLF